MIPLVTSTNTTVASGSPTLARPPEVERGVGLQHFKAHQYIYAIPVRTGVNISLILGSTSAHKRISRPYPIRGFCARFPFQWLNLAPGCGVWKAWLCSRHRHYHCYCSCYCYCHYHYTLTIYTVITCTPTNAT